MRRSILSTLLAVVLLFSMVTAVGARGSFGFSSGNINVGSLIFTGVAKGLGPDALLVTLDATAIITVECINNGGNFAAGVNHVEHDATTFVEIPPTEKNGKLVIEPGDVVLEDPELTAAELAASCQNSNWVGTQIGVSWTEVVVTMVHSSRTIIQTYDCTGVESGGDCAFVDEDVIEA